MLKIHFSTPLNLPGIIHIMDDEKDHPGMVLNEAGADTLIDKLCHTLWLMDQQRKRDKETQGSVQQPPTPPLPRPSMLEDDFDASDIDYWDMTGMGW